MWGSVGARVCYDVLHCALCLCVQHYVFMALCVWHCVYGSMYNMSLCVSFVGMTLLTLCFCHCTYVVCMALYAS